MAIVPLENPALFAYFGADRRLYRVRLAGFLTGHLLSADNGID